MTDPHVPTFSPVAPVKPRLRGVSHEIACYFSAMAGSYLVAQARNPEAMLGTGIYSLCLFLLFASSALYHRPHWSAPARARMRRLDHSAIYFMIAGTGTPVALIALDGNMKRAMLLTLWIGAALGVGTSLLWIHAPKPVTALAYVLMGLSVLPFLPEISTTLGPLGIGLFMTGGVVYVIGAVVYAFRKPDPVPHVFGYHEIFHALVVMAAALQYAAILRIVKAAAS